MTPPRGSSMTTWHYRCGPELLILENEQRHLRTIRRDCSKCGSSVDRATRRYRKCEDSEVLVVASVGGCARRKFREKPKNSLARTRWSLVQGLPRGSTLAARREGR